MFKKSRNHSDSNVKCKKLEELILPNAKLKFCSEQLQNLNYIFHKKLQQKSLVLSDKSLLLARSVAERLVQRLLCCAGMLDERFSSKFLISNHNYQQQSSQHAIIAPRNLEYLIRLDCLSTPTIYATDPPPKHSIIETDPDYPTAYARIRLHQTSLKLWSDCSNSAGYLRRDKVQARLVELLAQAAGSDYPSSPLNVDESVHCGIPGKIVDPFSLYQILKCPTENHCFYGPAGNVPRFPDPRDFRLAIVDEPDGIKLRLEFLSPALSNYSISVRILVAIGIESWPSSTNFPSKIPLGHTDCLLYHQAAQTGMYLVGYGVQSSAWQIRLPAAEFVILNHYGSNSTIKTILDILYDTLEEIEMNRQRHHQLSSYKILNRYMFLTILLKELEENSTNPSIDLVTWSPIYLSTHTLRLLDKMMVGLIAQNFPNYFFDKSNLLVNPGHLCEDDYLIEANNIKLYLIRLFDESLMSTKSNDEFHRLIVAQDTEMILLYKWKELIDNLLPGAAVKGRRFRFVGLNRSKETTYTQYTFRQLEYIGILLQNVLNVRQNILQTDSVWLIDNKPENSPDNNNLEDVIYILVSIMDQARDQYLQTNQNAIKNSATKIKIQFNTCTSKLVEVIRKDKDLNSLQFDDDLVLVKVILKWLYKALETNKKYLAPILRPYLNDLFRTSHSISWHLEFIKDRLNNDELQALGAFTKLINSNSLSPAEGLIDAVNKNWLWAKSMLSMVERNTLRVIFILNRGQVYRHILSLPSYQKNNNSLEVGSNRTFSHSSQNRTLPQTRNYFNTLLSQKSSSNSDGKYSEVSPQYEVLKISSPLTFIFERMHRRGEHRGYGDIFKSLLAMQKLSMFQEVTGSLPEEDRVEISELIQDIQVLKTRNAASKKWSNTLPQLHRNRRINQFSSKKEFVQKYTPKEESAGIRLEELSKTRAKTDDTNHMSLIRSCRAARIREDNNIFMFHQDNFKIKSLLNKSESFKY